MTMDEADAIPGFFAPVHRAVTEPITGPRARALAAPQ